MKLTKQKYDKIRRNIQKTNEKICKKLRKT